MMELARLGNKYLADTEPWKLIKVDEKRVESIMHVSLQIVASMGAFCEPFLPFTAAKLSDMMNIDIPEWEKSKAFNLLSPDHQILPASLLFEKIEDEVIEKQIQKIFTDFNFQQYVWEGDRRKNAP